MALDSRQKRAAVVGTGRLWYRNPHPSSLDASQRASIGQVYPVAVFQGLSAPVFSGTIPDITATFGDPDVVTDLSIYFTGATSYSIAPGVETGWTFDTITGILTIDTDVADTFGAYVITGTNASGSDGSNAFNVIVSVADDEAYSGGFWFDYDSEILRRNILRRKLKEDKEKELKRIQKLQDDLEKQLALEEAKHKEEEERYIELEMINKVVSEHKAQIEREFSDKLLLTVNRAIIKSSYSAIEQLERELRQFKEEEEFLMLAAGILLRQ